MADPSLTIRVPQPIRDRLDAAVERAGCTTTQWILEAVRYALERDEAPHVPAAVRAAMPRRIGNRIQMPEGIRTDPFGPQ